MNWDNLDDSRFKELGFKCGLEVHQQLDTAKKLFCRCPVGYVDGPPDGLIVRHMRPTLSELGEYDGTALMEFKTKKEVVYELFRDNVCTYEMDDTPPFPINQEALDIALQISMLFNCHIVDELHITRKQYLDGSIPTGFQRTAIVGVEGWIPYKDRKIRIIQVALEEDACREVHDIGHQIRFRTDRLSTPLVEIVTYPDMQTPTEAMEVDEVIGRVLRSSGRVRRGIGVTRQDVNVSIDGGTRVELKGIDKTGYIKRLTEVEGLRQKSLLEIKSELRKRGISPSTIHSEKKDLTEIFKKIAHPVISEVINNGGKVGGIMLERFAGILNYKTQPNKTFADEISGRIKVIACIDKYPNIIHSDDISCAELPDEICDEIKKVFHMRHTDAIIITWGTEADVNMALSEVKIRAVEATEGVPNETRQHIGEGITDFERILPGPDRMYPDTDSSPVAITKDRLDKLRAVLPDPAYSRDERWMELGLSDELVYSLGRSKFALMYDRLLKRNLTDPVFLAYLFEGYLKNLKRQGRDLIFISDDLLAYILEQTGQRELPNEAVYVALDYLSSNGTNIPLERLFDELNLIPMTESDVSSLIESKAAELDGDRFKSEEKLIEYIIGQVKSETRGKFPPEKLKDMVKEQVKAKHPATS
ncbi:MAG TPA: Glu-tRNA(Gln) amidotransferase subunit GatE [candidate division Zixibacteria bacterium]|nr:Glu-tRNA(Gln) amidotransferase subunit GatE [candidate division Zixibacteria bacterium]HEQ98366.1 Glu-tRNA(Gln) amidotransferase subunit GatE [candidate division Zixibacteria bacterium]